MDTTTFLVILAIVILLINWRGPNAVWGGATLGAIIGVINSIAQGDWETLPVFFSVGTLLGFVFERIFRLSKR